MVIKGDASKSAGGVARRAGIYAAVLGVVFLLGFAPMWWRARGYAEERERAERSLRVSRLENLIGGAALDAGRGRYEPARAAMSDFFTRLRAEVDLRDRSAIAPERLEATETLLAARDETITMLARGDAASAGRLGDLYFAFKQAVGSS